MKLDADPDPAVYFEKMAEAGALRVLEEHPEAAADTWSWDLLIRKVREENPFRVPVRMHAPLWRRLDEAVYLKQELERFSGLTKFPVDDPDSVVRSVVRAFSGSELRRFPDFYPAMNRWLMRWIVQQRYDDGSLDQDEIQEHLAQRFLAMEFESRMEQLAQDRLYGKVEQKEGAHQVEPSPVDGFSGGFDFEAHVVLLLKKAGFEVHEVSLEDAYGVDILVETFDLELVVQCRWFTPCGLDAVQSVVAAMQHFDARSGLVVSPHEPTKAALQYAGSSGVALLGLEDLKRLENEQAL